MSYVTKANLIKIWAKIKALFYTRAEVDALIASGGGSGGGNSGTTTTIFDTSTYVGAIAVANETSNITITLNDNVQAGDKIRVYINGGVEYQHMQAAIIEFELYNPTENSLAGIGSVMSDTGASIGIISASVSSKLKITNQLKITIYCLTNTVYASGSNVYVSKVERLRSVATTTYISGDNVAYGSGSTITNYEYEDVIGTAIDGDDLTYGGDS